MIKCTNRGFLRMERPKSNSSLLEIVLSKQDANSTLETGLRSQIGSVVSEEIVFKVVSSIGHEIEGFYSKIDQQIVELETV